MGCHREGCDRCVVCGPVKPVRDAPTLVCSNCLDDRGLPPVPEDEHPDEERAAEKIAATEADFAQDQTEDQSEASAESQ